MNNVVEVNVVTDGDKSYIVFDFEEKIKLDITSDDKDKIKSVFYKILEKIISNDTLSFNFNKNADDLYNDISEKYIKDLNNELEILKKDFVNPNIK